MQIRSSKRKKKRPRLTDKQRYIITKEARAQAHQMFDDIWQKENTDYRDDLYRWLSKHMDIPYEKCHFSKFGPSKCKRAMNILKKGVKKRILPKSRVNHETTNL